MFQFTTTHVINSYLDASTGKALWSLGTDKDGKNTLNFKGVNIFKEDNVKAIYKCDAWDPKLESAKVNFSKITDAKPGDTFRLSVYIRLTEDESSSYYANDTRYQGRPFSVEFPWKGEDTVKNLLKLIKKYNLLVFEKEILKVSKDKENSKKLVLEAVNEFQRFYTIKLEKFLNPESPFADEWEEVEDAVEVEKGYSGFGTYSYLSRNIKLPTKWNTEPWAVRSNEMPVPGAKYTQITVHYCTNRGPLGLNAVGLNVQSETVSVFFINKALLNKESVVELNYTKLEDGEEVEVQTEASTIVDAFKTLGGDKFEDVTPEDRKETESGSTDASTEP